MVTKEYRVEGPVMLFLTTTAIDIDEELMNRCLVLTVNESREQTQAIHAMQRQQQTLEGLLQNEDKKQLIQLHRNAQRLLKPLLVANPFAEQLTFIDDKTRTRRDHMKYLTLIRSIALLHQYQREIKRIEHNGQALEYIEVTLADIEIANKLAHEVLGRTLEELPPQTYTLLKHIKTMVTKACKKQEMEQKDYRFSRRDIREVTGWSDGQLKIHCSRLTELEYLLVHRGGRGHSIVYELLYDGELNDDKHLMGLIDVEKLRYDEEKSGIKPQKSAPSQGQVRPKSALSQGIENGDIPQADNDLNETLPEADKKRYIRPKKNTESYRSHTPSLVAKGV
jgi:post-segregation antitoxin (ccd killing protein)